MCLLMNYKQKPMKKLMMFLPFLLLMACSGNGQQATEAGGDVDVSQFEELIHSGEGTLLDVRTPGEYAEGAIAGAKNVDVTAPGFLQKVEALKLKKEEPVYLYCRSGGRSTRAMNILQEQGFTKVYNLEGGFTAWSREHP